ncbi:DEAD/DEAH box helicase family protein [Caproiciproducens sp. AGMB10547]|uniref:DEAD/DEAH box helicase family protein n=1 Tax=Caproiciproducens faecalis TaxID=2820301 RepID=A0ABS7DLZ5_9FIRM|nr:DEAD/DEAH box helicase family protein [Caproiciproducens faecalis]
MPSNVQALAQMADRAATQITASHESWTDFLKTAARLYKYPYHEQLMIYAQRPDATACAGYEIWNEKMRRYIRRGRKGIALIDASGDKPRIRYVFDISDTGDSENSRRPYLWQYRPEHEDAVTAALEREYAVSGEKGLAYQLEQIAGQLANEYRQEHQYDILHIVDGSFLEEYDEFNIGAQFRSAASVSITYAVLSRCGLEPDEYFEHEDFLSIFDFNTPDTVAALGTAVSEASEKVLRQIEVTVKNYEREHLAERSATHGEQPDLHQERGLPDSGPDDHGADGEHREIREDAQKLPEGAPSGAVQQPVVVGEAVPAPVGDRADGNGAAGVHDAGADEVGRRDGEPESLRPDALGGLHERPESAGRGNDTDGAYLQLSFFPSEQEQIQRIDEAESEKPSAFSVPAPQKSEKSGTAQADIDAALQEWNGSTESKRAVVEYMREHARDKDTAAFLRAEYGDDLPAFPVTVGRTSTDLPWPKVQRRIAQLIRENRFYTPEEQPAPPDLSDQPITRTGDTIENGITFHNVVLSLSGEQREDVQQAIPENATIPLPYKVGDTVYLDNKPFEITDIGTSDVQLHDPALAYPIFRAESRENFENMLRRDSRNGPITEFLAADLEHTEADLREALTSGLLEQRDKEHIAGYFRENEGNTRVAQRLSLTYAGTSDTMELTTGETADLFATTTGFEINIHDKYNSKRSARWEEIAPILRALYQREQDGFSHEPVLREPANLDGKPFYQPGGHAVLDYGGQELSGTVGYAGEKDVRIDTGPYSWSHEVVSRDAFENGIRQDERNAALFTPEQPAAENFRITDDHLGVGGAKTKYGYNIAAIRNLKTIEAEGRTATQEEQETLSRYVGWGGIPQAFDPDNAAWSKEYTELVGALTAEEYEMARASTLNAHYTSPTVIKAIYEAVKNLGFQTGNILEPACGVGNFFGLLPDSMAASRLYGVELDNITGRIAKQLYPNANITVAGFETTERKDFFDLAVGNVPFGSYKVSDRAYDKLGFPIHDYFFAKTLDQVRPGGVIAFVTSRYTMDKQSPEVRRYIAQRADLLGAIRLPSNAFKANAGTEVTTDILFLQKRDRPIVIEPDWVHLGQTEDGIPVNSYFADHPEMVLGTIKWDDKMHGDKKETTCEPFPDADLSEQLHEVVSHIQGQVTELDTPDLGENEEIDDSIPADPDVKNYSYTVVDGEVYYRENSRMVRPELNETAKARVMGMVELRDCVQKLINQQLDESASDAEIHKTQAELNTLYGAFSAKYGLINSRGNSLAFSEDSSYYLLCSLEVIDEDGKLERKADMFTKRTIRQRKIVTSVDTASEALSLSIAEKARVDMDYMASLTGKTPETLADELRGVIFRDFGEQDPASVPKAFYKLDNIPFVTADEYLSGNVRRKLRLAKALAEMRPDLAEKISPNIEALEAAQPKDLDASEVEVRLGATWIDKEYIQQFMEELLNPPSGVRDGIRINYSSFTAEWAISNKNSVGYNDIAAYVTYGTDRANAYRILEDSLNLRDTRIYDTVTDPDGKVRRVLNSKETTLAQQKQQAVKDAFHDWIWRDPERRRTLTKKYNELFNSSRPREYDGRHLVFPGMNPEIKLRDHQLNAVAHQLYGGNTLLAHVVGAGKTYEMIAAAMEGKRLGLCQKSLFAVPNHLTEQWASEFLRLYPSANILVTTKKDFEKRNRKKFCARIATGDYDAIIMGHSQFEKIPVSLERQKRLIQEQIWEIENGLEELKDSGAEQFTIKQLERTKKGLEARLKRLNDNSRKDDVVTFEQLGVDRLFVDEAHNYKNLFLYTKMRNVAGLSTTDAQKSSDMFLKCRYLDEITHSRGVVFATGTPVSNSMTELYTMMRYLQYETLKEQNLVHFDCWASTFGETMTAIELAPEGTGYRARTRFARFYNLPELMLLFKEAADIKTADQLNLPTPKAVYHNEVAQPSEIQKEMVKKLSERAAAVHSGSVDPHLDNMLKITSDGRKLGLDQRVINPMLPDNPGSKVNMCVNNVFRFWHDGQDKKLTQLVFCDISTPKGRAAAKENRAVRAGGKLAGGTELHALQDATPEADAPEAFSVYSDIRDKLIARGVPSEQIAFIHDADTEIKKKELFAKVRAGQVRVLMGSTAKMGAGMNVQDLLIASHDLDCPWRPGDLEQRSGRIIRQYNTNPEGHIFRYVTEGTFDSYLWQTVENKQKFISQIMTSKSPVRSCEDIDETALSYAEIKALCAGDERIKEKMDLDMDVAKLKLMKANHQSQQFRLEDNLLKYFPEEIERNKGFIKGLETDMATLEAHPHPKDGFAEMVVRGDSLTDKDNAGAAILEACKEVKGLEPIAIGSYRGFTMSLSVEGFGQDFILTLKGQMSHRVTLGKDARGNLIRIDNALSDMPKRLQNVYSQLDNLHSQIAAAKAEIGKPFPQEAELAQKSARLAELNALLDIDSRAPAQRQASEVLEKSERPSVLESLKTPCVCGTGKKLKHELAR